jgi:hypothetical protein
MKLDAKDVKFVGIIPWVDRRSMRFVGRGNSIQLLETALVIEGNQKTIGLIVVDLLFQQALSEWTTVTIPYSRVEGLQFKRLWLQKLLFLTPFFLCLWLPCLAVTIGGAVVAVAKPDSFRPKTNQSDSKLELSSGGASSPIEETPWILPLTLGLELAVATAAGIFIAVRFLGARHYLTFFRADGQRMLTCFAIRKRAMRKAFEERLEANRQTAGTSPAARSEGLKTTVNRGPNP